MEAPNKSKADKRQFQEKIHCSGTQ